MQIENNIWVKKEMKGEKRPQKKKSDNFLNFIEK